MKVVFAGVGFAMLMASPLFAQPQGTEGPLNSGTYRDQQKQLRIDYRGLNGSARKSNRSTSNPDPMKQELCSTAPGFCPDHHGGNGG